MNWLQFGRLIHSIYSRNEKLPDIEWIQSLGLLAVKLGQVHALRIDFLDRDKCEHLSRLYRQNLPLEAEDFFALLKSCGIEGFEDRFESINPVPLATASIGQVHRARLRDGAEVVIKAVKPGLRDKFSRDVRSLKRLFRFATTFYPPLKRAGDPEGILEDIDALTSTELDLRNEASGHRELEDTRDCQRVEFDLSMLKFPRLHESLSNENVLVTEYIDAPSVDELLERETLAYEQLLDLFRIHGFFMFIAGTFHGDLHPGNVLIENDDFYFIDTGYIGRVEDRLRRGLFDFFEALTRYDYSGSARALHEMSVQKLDQVSFARFRREFLSLYDGFKGASVSQISLTTKMMQTIKLGVRSGMSFDRGMFGIIRSLMYLDGMVLRCNPDAVLIRDMRVPVEEMLSLLPHGPAVTRIGG